LKYLDEFVHLGSFKGDAEAAELILNSASPNLQELKEILVDIRRDDQLASEVILRLRRLLKKATPDFKQIDLNDAVGEVLRFLAAHASERNITMIGHFDPQGPRVKGDTRKHVESVKLLAWVGDANSSLGRRPNILSSALGWPRRGSRASRIQF
jgi:signal transduction histidine kinase